MGANHCVTCPCGRVPAGVGDHRYLSRRYPGGRWAPLRAALAGGLAGRYALSRAFPGVGEGAAPTRPATLLDPAPPVGPGPRGGPASGVDAFPIRSEG